MTMCAFIFDVSEEVRGRAIAQRARTHKEENRNVHAHARSRYNANTIIKTREKQEIKAKNYVSFGARADLSARVDDIRACCQRMRRVNISTALSFESK